ncbi:MAG TPA: TonB-dependent receptor, partial [Candidatus Dormibacteraeota bacterium]|nr:TonB-dependent receptor [Candidatus Dormibacteraeota bacterium]
SNPFQTVALFRSPESVWRSLLSGRASWDVLVTPSHTLRFVASGGGDIFTQKNKAFSPPDLQYELISGLPGTSVIGFSQSQNFNANGNLVHIYKTAGGTTATTQVGVQFESADFDRSSTLNQNLIGGQPNAGSGTVTRVEEYRERVRDLGYFAQEELLTLDERLLLTAGVRADRSTNNADVNKLYFFPKFAASYRVPMAGDLITELKLRGAYGESGNRPTYGQKYTNLTPGNIGGVPISQIATSTGAADLRPERQQELEGGLDATLLQGRVQVGATAYQKRISDLLLTRTLPPSAGFTQLVYNGGVIRNRGFEADVGVLPIQKPELQWNVHGTFHLNRCTVTSLPNGTFRPIAFFNFLQFGTAQIEAGKSCTQIVAQDTLGALPGDAALGKLGTVVHRPIGDNAPSWHAGLSNDLTYKRWKLYFLWDGQHGGLVTNFSLYTYDCVGTSVDQVPFGDQRCASNSGRSTTTSVSYLKLREVTLTLDLPEAFVHRYWSGARFVRVGVSGKNLLTFTPYRGYDPEVQQVARSLAAETSWELWSYPASRQFLFSIEAGF